MLLHFNRGCFVERKGELLLIWELSVSVGLLSVGPNNTSHIFIGLIKWVHGISKMFYIQEVAQYHKKLQSTCLIF